MKRHIEIKSAILFILLLLPSLVLLAQSNWKPVEGHIMSKWAEEVSPESVWAEYPRPQMTRDEWKNLNGLWDYALLPQGSEAPKQFDGKILVPFAIETALSGVKKRISQKEVLWYRKRFEVPASWKGQNVLLHFEAVDWETVVYVNGIKMGMHQGGYDPFSFDITRALKPDGEQEILLSVWDPGSEGTQPRGKQVTNPRGIWYTPVSGIWQTVWVEPVPDQSIQSLKVTPDIDSESLAVTVSGSTFSSVGEEVIVTAFDGNKEVATAKGTLGEELVLKINNSKLWSPDSPFLYDLKVVLQQKNKTLDEVDSYFGMRKIAIKKDEAGYYRFQLNNENLFMYGTLDQGWWPGGLYTAPTDEALKYDIEMTKACGFNTIRKHVKVEPARWYYHCDKLGMLVWQDMPSGDKSADWRGPSGYDGREMKRTGQSAQQFYTEWKAIMDANYNKPSIVMWVPFNEGWGQFNTVEVTKWTMEYDPSRLVNGPSGGNFFPVGHTIDHHQYPGPGMPKLKEHAPEIMEGRAWLLGEFGGLGLPIEGHLWQKDKNWGYRNYGTRDELVNNYAKLIEQFPELIKTGMSAAVYTQTTDVEGEVNGLMTYDRAILKMDAERMKGIIGSVYKKYLKD